LEKYNAYKEELRWQIAKMGFEMPVGYFAIWFCIPFPASWMPRKTKCREMEGMPHQNTPDCDNLLKAFFDAVMPRKNKTRQEKGSDDRKIHCYAAFKIWVKPEDACIKIVEYDQSEFMSQFLTYYVV
jgi:Holliday junction resolvase RusA-like endonuclease